MLAPIILASLGAAVFSDSHRQILDRGLYTIFEWNNGMKMGRTLHHGSERVFYCGELYLFGIDDDNYLETHSLQFLMIKDKVLICQRLAWLALIYLDCKFNTTFGYGGPGWDLLPKIIPDGFVDFAEKGAPDKADPYEMTIYETGQMDKSLFMLNQDDFLKTIGRS